MSITPAKQMVDEATRNIRSLSPEEVMACLDDPNYQLVDIRDIRELEKEGTLPNAFHAPRGMLEFWVDPQSPYFKEVFKADKTFVFYCASAWRSALSVQTLQAMGVPQVAQLAGGFKAWKKAGGKIVPLDQNA